MRQSLSLHWVHSPEDEGEATDGSEEGGGLIVLGLGGLATVEGNLVDDNEVGKASHGIPAPLGRFINLESSEETSEDHDDVGNDGNEDAGTVQASQEAQIEKEEWGGDSPIDIAGPVHLTVDGLVGVWEMLLGLLDEDLVLANTITNCHGVV